MYYGVVSKGAAFFYADLKNFSAFTQKTLRKFYLILTFS